MGYGPITPLLQDNAITEIMVNAPNEIYVEIDGKIAKDETQTKWWNNCIKS